MLHVVPAGILSFPSGYTIERALVFDGAADFLKRTYYKAGTEETWACSFWAKGFKVNTTQYIFSSRIDGSNTGYIELLSGSGNQLQMRDYDESARHQVKTNAILRDQTAWYHFLCVNDTTNGTSADNQRIYINGIRQEIASLSPSVSADDYASVVGINSANSHYIGQDGNDQNWYYGSIAEFIFVDGSTTTTTVDSANKLTSNELGEFDSKGVWVPKNPSSVTFGTNGFHLKFDDPNLLGKSTTTTTTPSVSHLGSAVTTSTGQVHTISGATWGSAASNRSLVIATGGARNNAGTRSVQSLTVGGSAATFVARQNSGAGNVTEFWYIALPTGTSGDIVVTYTGGNTTMDSIGTSWWRVLDAGQPISTNGNTGSSWTTQDVTTIGQTGDVAFYANFDSAGVPAGGSNAVTGYSWSNATESSEHLNILSGPTDGSSGTHLAFTSAYFTFTSAGPHTETLTIAAGEGNDNSYLGVTFSNNNTFETTSIDPSNVTPDSCTDDTGSEVDLYPTIDPVGPFGIAENTLSNNNFTWVSGSSANKWNYSTIPISNTDKVYMEFHQSGNCGGSHTPGFSITDRDHPGGDKYPGQTNNDWGLYLGIGATSNSAQIGHDRGTLGNAGRILNAQVGGADGDVYMMARHGANLWFGANGTWYDSATSTEIANGTTTNSQFNSGQHPLPTDIPLFVGFHCYGSQASLTWKPFADEWNYSAPTGFGEMKSVLSNGNYCTWNFTDPFPSAKAQLSNGNRTATMDADSAIRGTHFFDVTDSTGYYWETTFTANVGNASHVGISIANGKNPPLNNTSYRDTGVATYLSDGGSEGTWSGGLGTTGNRASGGTHATYATGDTIMVAVKSGAIWFGKNGSWIDGANGGASSSTVLSEINSGTTTNSFFHTITGFFTPMIREHNGTNTTSTTNWGQRPFLYTPPTNMKKLRTADYSAPTVTDPSKFFQNVLYDGTGGTQSITFGGNSDMQPDFVWIKRRNVSGTNHLLFDSVRGATKHLNSAAQTAETTTADTLTAFNSDGFTLGADAGGYGSNVSTSSSKYVAWCWKAGGSGSSDDTGGITVTRSTASHQGFSICKGTSGTGTQNFAHGLGAKPEFVILRDLEDGSQHFQVQHKDVNTNMKDITTLGLNRNVDAGSSTDWWGAEPTSTLQYFTTSQVTSTNDFVCYLFRRIPGLIGIGSYIGNGQDDDDGPFIAIDDGASGFKPAFLMLKEYNGSNNGLWFIRDNAREPINPTKTDLYASSTVVEYTDSNSDIDFYANGFKIRADAGGYNQNGANNLYIAFAENPFGGDSIAQAKAR